ncbi:hypothetical protein CA51_13570 [Rosistilla oblonga]|uniref:hypothetical protein n=1 Tax=Rosistilla oblonga TaxID=2527990 RepID=UPI00118B44B7|nr:hypothetical protein [Rosistilla oblonga]QDV11493.1 hypothetical protein CA51_13570 [Rosistilla oblonga]
MSTGDDTVFTEHVKQLGTGTTEIPDVVRKKLAARLKSMIRKRGLANLSATTFGYSGKFLGDAVTLDEVMDDAYCHLFFGTGARAGKQFAFLQKQVETGNAIDPLIQKELFRFVHDLHRNAFPNDSAIYKNVLAAAKMLVDDPENDVSLRDGNDRKPNLASVLKMSGDAQNFAETALIERAIRGNDGWHKTLGLVRRFSKKATCGVSEGTLAMMHQGTRPLLLQLLKESISDLAYDPIETAAMTSAADFTGEDTKGPEFVRTILDEDRYEVRQSKVDEFVHEGRRAIKSLGCNNTTTETLLEILHCYAEKCRRCACDEYISQEQVRKDIGLKKQTMSDYMGKLRAALETIKS